MKVGDSVKTKGRTCWHCRGVNDGATAIGQEGPIYPRDGDLCICIKCGVLGLFERDQTRELSSAELSDLVAGPNWPWIQAGLHNWSRMQK